MFKFITGTFGVLFVASAGVAIELTIIDGPHTSGGVAAGVLGIVGIAAGVLGLVSILWDQFG